MKSGMIAVTAFLLVAWAPPLSADMLLTVQCASGNQTAIQQFLVQSVAGTTGWTLPESVNLMSGGVRLGTIESLDVQSDVDPYVNLQFAVTAGGTDTTFDIQSSVVSFAPLSNPSAYASAGVTLTSDDDGATITGLFDGGKAYQARYNGGTVFADLVDGFSIPKDQTVVGSGRSPSGGYQTIFDSVSSIESEFDFTLSALDQASGTSRFEVVAAPEPASLSLILLGGLALVRRKK